MAQDVEYVPVCFLQNQPTLIDRAPFSWPEKMPLGWNKFSMKIGAKILILTWKPYMVNGHTPRGFSKFIYFSIFFIAFFLSHTYNLYLFLLYISFQSFHLSRPLILKSFWVSTSLFKYILFHTFLKMFVFQINVS